MNVSATDTNELLVPRFEPTTKSKPLFKDCQVSKTLSASHKRRQDLLCLLQKKDLQSGMHLQNGH